MKEKIILLLLVATFLVGCSTNEDNAADISIFPDKLELNVGETILLSVTGTEANEKIIWESLNTEIASVDNTGLVSAIKEGVVTISASLGCSTSICTITVLHKPQVEKIILASSELEISRGDSILINPTILPLDADKTSLIYKSSDTDIAEVSDEGMIKALSPGQATITVSADGVSEDCDITVTPRRIKEIIIETEKDIIKKGESVQLVAKTVPEDSDNDVIDWSSSDEWVATVDKDGTVNGIAVGITTITASCGDVHTECVITVTGQPKIGDWYYDDGTYSFEVNPNKKIIGIVFWTGDPGKDDDFLKEEHPQCSNGLVVSIKENNEFALWQESSAWKTHKEKIGLWIESNTEYPSTIITDLSDSRAETILGYSLSKGLEEYRKAHPEYRIAISEGLKRFADSDPAPETSSGWFIPSIEELDLLCNGDAHGRPDWEPLTNKKIINGRLAMIEAEQFDNYVYWSSMELDIDNAFVFAFDQGLPMIDYKPTSRQIRYILAF